jgi:serine/threonine protein kinase
MILGESVLSIDLNTLLPFDPIDVTWPFITNPLEIDVTDAKQINEGGYGKVYRLKNGHILKIIKASGHSENALFYRELKSNMDLPKSTPLLYLYQDYTKEQDDQLDFIQQVRLEVEFQRIAYNHVKAIDGTPVTSNIYGAGVVQSDQLYGIIVMGEVVGYPMNSTLYKSISPKALWSIMDQLVRIMYSLHSLGFCHNDMVQDNIILTNLQHPVVKIIDWGNSCMNLVAPFWGNTVHSIRILPTFIQHQIITEQLYIEKHHSLVNHHIVLDIATYREIKDIQLFLQKPHFGRRSNRKSKFTSKSRSKRTSNRKSKCTSKRTSKRTSNSKYKN